MNQTLQAACINALNAVTRALPELAKNVRRVAVALEKANGVERERLDWERRP